jgi:hypothetical protein
MPAVAGGGGTKQCIGRHRNHARPVGKVNASTVSGPSHVRCAARAARWTRMVGPRALQ